MNLSLEDATAEIGATRQGFSKLLCWPDARFLQLVPKLQFGRALVPEALLRRGAATSTDRTATAAARPASTHAPTNNANAPAQ